MPQHIVLYMHVSVLTIMCIQYNKTRQPWFSVLAVCLCGSSIPGFSSIFPSLFFFSSCVCVFVYRERVRERVYTIL